MCFKNLTISYFKWPTYSSRFQWKQDRLPPHLLCHYLLKCAIYFHEDEKKVENLQYLYLATCSWGVKRFIFLFLFSLEKYLSSKREPLLTAGEYIPQDFIKPSNRISV